MNETPLPLTVCATSAFGASPPSRNRAKTPRSARVVVPVGRLDVPAERAQLRLEVAERDDLLRPLVGLHLVAVDDDPEAPEPLVGGGLERLPVLALLELPVARHHDDPPLAPERALRQRDPASLRDAHPERARAGLDPRHADVRVTVEPPEATEPEETLARDDPEREERRIEAGHVVALGGEEDVPVGVLEPAPGDVELLEQQLDDEVERAERGAEVPRAGPLDRDERVQPAGVREQRQPRVGVDVRRAQPIELSLGDEAQIRHGRDGSARAPRRSRGGRRPGRPARRTPRPRRRRATSRGGRGPPRRRARGAPRSRGGVATAPPRARRAAT